MWKNYWVTATFNYVLRAYFKISRKLTQKCSGYNNNYDHWS